MPDNANPMPFPHEHHHEPTEPPAAAPVVPGMGTHGFLVVGQATLFLSHLPMFMAPHDYQVVLQVSMRSADFDPREKYLADQAASKSTVYTFKPEELSLIEFVSADADRLPRVTMNGSLFRGNFFVKEGPEFAKNVTAMVDRIIHFRQYTPTVMPEGPLEYLYFGRGTDTFLARYVTRPPDFDQMLSATVLGVDFSVEQLRHGVHVKIPTRTRDSANRLMNSEIVTGEVMLPGCHGMEKQEVQVRVNRELFFEPRFLAN